MIRYPAVARHTVVAIALVAAGCSGSDRSIEAFCTQLGEMNRTDLSFDDIDLDDSVAVTEALTSFSTEFEELATVSPGDITDDVETVARFGTALADAALEANPDDPFDRAALLAGASAAEPDAPESMAAVSTYAARHCTAAPG